MQAPFDAVEQTLRTYLMKNSSGIAAAYIFGSVARGEARTGSDVDLAVLFSFQPAATIDSPPFLLEGELERLLRLNVQVIALNKAPVDLVHRVLRDGKLVLETDRTARIQFEVKARSLYFDLLPILEEYRRCAASRS